MDYLALLYRYYPEDNALRRMLLHHSRQVCTRALQIVDRHPELGANRALVEAGAMLHDIGIFRTDAPGIYCHGTAHYLLHGIIGAQLLREEAELLRQKAEHEGSTSSLKKKTLLSMKPLRASASATPEQDSRAKSSLSVVFPCPTKTFCQKPSKSKSFVTPISFIAKATWSANAASLRPSRV